jgi:protein-S-isoprenylcysteine O-methyltransferase Ste14
MIVRRHPLKKYAPYILPVLLLGGLAVLGYRKIAFHSGLWANCMINLDVPVIGMYMAWIVYEIAISRRDVTQEKVVSDRGTREFYGTSQALTVFSALWCDPLWTGPGLCHLAGLLVFLSGVLLRVWAIRSLGQYYSHMVRTIGDHRIVDTGPYRLVRHPAYAGMITAHLGITVFYFNYATLLIFSLLLIPSIVIRIFVEEKTLIAIDGYAEFSKKRKRIVPFLW